MTILTGTRSRRIGITRAAGVALSAVFVLLALALPAGASSAVDEEITTVDRLRAQETAVLKDTGSVDSSPSREPSSRGSEWPDAGLAALVAAAAAVTLGIATTRRRLRAHEL